MRYRRRIVRGYLDMGRAEVPPLPQNIVLTDRDDGTLWQLSHNTVIHSLDGVGHISIKDPSSFNSRPYGSHIYPAFEGPLLGTNPTVRLLVRNGHLGYEISPLPAHHTDRDNAPVFTRNVNQREVREIVVPTTWRVAGDVLGWVPTSL